MAGRTADQCGVLSVGKQFHAGVTVSLPQFVHQQSTAQRLSACCLTGWRMLERLADPESVSSVSPCCCVRLCPVVAVSRPVAAPLCLQGSISVCSNILLMSSHTRPSSGLFRRLRAEITSCCLVPGSGQFWRSVRRSCDPSSAAAAEEPLPA